MTVERFISLHHSGDEARRRKEVLAKRKTLMEQVQAEYAEMPGLSVTLSQAQRLWAVDRATCEDVFSRLVAKGVLRMTTKGRFVRV
jgi:hypothetical protein